MSNGFGTSQPPHTGIQRQPIAVNFSAPPPAFIPPVNGNAFPARVNNTFLMRPPATQTLRYSNICEFFSKNIPWFYANGSAVERCSPEQPKPQPPNNNKQSYLTNTVDPPNELQNVKKDSSDDMNNTAPNTNSNSPAPGYSTFFNIMTWVLFYPQR